MKGVSMKRLIARPGLSFLVFFWAFVFSMPLAWADDAIILDPALKGYIKVSGVSGNVNSIGSDTLNNLMTLWAEGFRKQYPNVKIQIEGKGSSTAPPALIEGTAQLGPMSRTMKNTELDAFERKFRYKPTAFPVAIDALAVQEPSLGPQREHSALETSRLG
jgi:phosphate transport system substrate-binding protein